MISTHINSIVKSHCGSAEEKLDESSCVKLSVQPVRGAEWTAPRPFLNGAFGLVVPFFQPTRTACSRHAHQTTISVPGHHQWDVYDSQPCQANYLTMRTAAVDKCGHHKPRSCVRDLRWNSTQMVHCAFFQTDLFTEDCFQVWSVQLSPCAWA